MVGINRTIKNYILQGVKDDDLEIYDLGLELLLAKLIHIITLISIGLLFGYLLEMFLFICFYSLLRKYAGGHHARKRSICYIITIGLAFMLVYCCSLASQRHYKVGSVSIGLFLLLAFIYILGPVDCQAKVLDKKEKQLYKKKLLICALCTWTLTIFLIYFNCNQAISVICYSCAVLAIMQLIALIQKGMRKRFRKKMIHLFKILILGMAFSFSGCKSQNKGNTISVSKITLLEINIHKEQESVMMEALLDMSTIRQMIGITHLSLEQKSDFTVAILDSGIYPHQCFTSQESKIVEFIDLVNDIQSPYDDNGHGTAVAGIIAGNHEEYQGIALETNIVVVKVLDYEGKANKSRLIEGVQWVIDNREKHNIRVMNISIGLPVENYDELSNKIDEAYDLGIMTVASSGNNLLDQDDIKYSPAVSEKAITVGAIEEHEVKSDFDYRVASFTSVWVSPKGYQKPEVIAPGNNILTAKSDIYYKGSGDIKDSKYSVNSGTSLAAAVTTGFISVLLSENSEITNDELRDKLYEDTIEIVNDENKFHFIFYGGE